MAAKTGIDVAKEFHWVAIVVAETGKALVSQRIDNDRGSIDGLVSQLRQAESDHGELTVGIAVMGGVASLLTAMLIDAGPLGGRCTRVPRGGTHVPGKRVTRPGAGRRRSRLPMPCLPSAPCRDLGEDRLGLQLVSE